MSVQRVASARAPDVMQSNPEKFARLIAVLRTKTWQEWGIPERTYYSYLAGVFPKIVHQIVEDEELALALLRDAVRLEVRREIEREGK